MKTLVRRKYSGSRNFTRWEKSSPFWASFLISERTRDWLSWFMLFDFIKCARLWLRQPRLIGLTHLRWARARRKPPIKSSLALGAFNLVGRWITLVDEVDRLIGFS